MILLKKIANRVNRGYLNIFYSTINLAKSSVVDYRCEIEGKNNISLGKNSILYKDTTIYKKDIGKFAMGDNSHIAPYGHFLMDKHNVTIGDGVVIAKNCSFFCVSNAIPKDNTLFKDSYTYGDIIIESNVFIGANCVVLPNSTIQKDVVVASNSTVKGVLESGYLYGGNPAKKIKKVYADE